MTTTLVSMLARRCLFNRSSDGQTKREQLINVFKTKQDYRYDVFKHKRRRE